MEDEEDSPIDIKPGIRLDEVDPLSVNPPIDIANENVHPMEEKTDIDGINEMLIDGMHFEAVSILKFSTFSYLAR